MTTTTASTDAPDDTDAEPGFASGGRRRVALLAALVLGLGLIAAPAIFQMFERAPLGGEMIDDFRPYMTDEQLTMFDGFMDDIDAADVETRRAFAPAADPEAVATLHERWPVIEDDMRGMLAVMTDNLGNFAAVDALPDFPLFPWFFVVPGVLVVAAAVAGLRSSARAPLVAVAVLGAGLIAAPAVFQMFERAPKGGEMLDELGPYMTEAKVDDIQGYFVTLGAAEGALRNRVLPGRADLPATSAFVDEWPRIASEMAPMVGVMADNLDNFAAVDALPPFPLFPWFFVIPGTMLAAAGAIALRGDPDRSTTTTEDP